MDYYGSCRTGLCLPTSDLDVVVLLNEWTSLHIPLQPVKDALLQAGVCSMESIKVLDRASVPIIKLTDVKTELRVQSFIIIPSVVLIAFGFVLVSR